jgi:hypothetical protein
MDDVISIVVIYIVLRAMFLFLRAWWRGDEWNDFRRDR